MLFAMQYSEQSEQLQAATVFVPYHADSPPISDTAVIYFIKMENS